MSKTLVFFLAQVVFISLSGVMAPGPMTMATLAAGGRRRHAGLLMAVGHGIVEFPLMVLLAVGLNELFKAQRFQIGVGLAGGAALVFMAISMLAACRKPEGNGVAAAKVGNPVWTGMVLTGANPYFLFWWATVGLTLITAGAALGITGVVLCAVVHWSCDLIWLEFLSQASSRGSGFWGEKGQRVILAGCGLVMGGFGLIFFHDAVRKWLVA